MRSGQKANDRGFFSIGRHGWTIVWTRENHYGTFLARTQDLVGTQKVRAFRKELLPLLAEQQQGTTYDKLSTRECFLLRVRVGPRRRRRSVKAAHLWCHLGSGLCGCANQFLFSQNTPPFSKKRLQKKSVRRCKNNVIFVDSSFKSQSPLPTVNTPDLQQ